MKHIVFLFSWLMASGVMANNSSSVSLLRVTPEGGVTYNSIICIAEDESGFIWFGSNDGLFYYNSIEIKRYSHFQSDPGSIPTNRINRIYNDRNGKLWIATENGLCFYNAKFDNFTTLHLTDQFGNTTGKNFNSFFQTDEGVYWYADEKGVATLTADNNQAFYINVNNKTTPVGNVSLDHRGTIWVFYNDGDIYYKLKSSNTFHFFAKGLAGTSRSVLIDVDKVWVAYESKGLLCLNMDGSVNTYFSAENKGETALPDNQVRSLIKDDNGQIWAGTYDGIAIISDFKVTSLINQEKYSELPNYSIWSLFKDSQENIWIGTYLGGLCFHSKYNKSFLHYTKSSPQSALSYNVVSSFAQVPGKMEIVVGTEDGVLNYFNPVTNKFRQKVVEYDGKTVKTIKSIAFDQQGRLWVGTYGHGVLYYDEKSDVFKPLTPPFTEGFQAIDLLVVENGLWVCNYPFGVYFYDFTSSEFTSYQHNEFDINSISDNNVRKIIEDREGNLWFATRNGLNLLPKGSTNFEHFFYEENNESSISSNIIYTILEDDKGFLWLGTNGEGLDKFNPKTRESETYTTKDGLSGNEIFSILEDRDKNLWLTTKQGLCKFNPENKNVLLFNNSNGIWNNRFNPNAAIVAANGEFYYGGTNGFVRFQPLEMPLNPVAPSTNITNLYINNKEIVSGLESNILSNVINKTKHLKLKYHQNSISFRFAANNFINADLNRFQYRLLGFSDDWTEINSLERATFTKVPPGNYIFEVKAANNDGVWNEATTQIAIQIIPPIWKRWYAYTSYVLLVLFVFGAFMRLFSNRQKLKHEIEKEKVKSESEEQVHQMKLQFFTNISHEFKTPLTLIHGPVKRLIKTQQEGTPLSNQLKLIRNNTERLLRLTNQILDFRKIESGKLKLNPVNGDVVAFCKYVYECFQGYASNRLFDYRFETEIETIKMDFDPDKLDKVLFNILSNAFKNTHDGGQIVFQIKNNKKSNPSIKGHQYCVGNDLMEDYVEIAISDNGKGMSEEVLPLVFERFYTIKDSAQQGTGIGLSLTKNYIAIHRGQLQVSTHEGEGSIFQIFIPQYQPGSEALNDTNSIEKVKEPYEPNVEYSEPMIKSEGLSVQNQEALVLIVEDNVDLLEYLSDLLRGFFRVAKAINGKQAFELIHSLFPDIVVSDIMMPEMDGIELCGKIKDDIQTSHIPVVLLTALDSVKDRIAGLHSGADAYIPKPFDDDLLLVQIDNLLQSRKNLRESFTSNNIKWEDNLGDLDVDKKFLLKAIGVVETNITNVDFTVETLADKLNFSRTHLHRKLKSLTDQSATEFIRYVRLKNAVKLMQTGQHKVNEVGYMVGFNSHNYFTKSFKKQYGKSPSEFIRDENSGKD